MIDALYKFGSQHILITIKNNKVYFANTQNGGMQSEIDGLKLNKDGVIKEFPHLKNDSDWKNKAINLFKEKINLMESENEILVYINEELKMFGYTPMYKQQRGFRPQLLN